MKGFKKFIAAVTIVGVLSAAGVSFAAAAMIPAEITAGLTGKTVEEVYQERQSGKSFGTIANESGKLEEFKAQMLEQKKAVLEQRVKEGKLTQEQADSISSNIKNNMANCNGSGEGGMGMGHGAGKGMGIGAGRGMCNGGGYGMGNGTETVK